MRFLSKELAQQFLLEIDKADLITKVDSTFIPDEEMEELFIKSRKSIIPKLKNFRKSQSSKESWRRNRYNIMKGIKSFHKSTEGKRFHRNMGRFLATRLFNKSNLTIGYSEKYDALKALSSSRTHLYIDTLYYKPMEEQINFELFLDEAVTSTVREEERIYSESYEYVEEDLDLIARMVPLKDLLQEICLSLNKKYDGSLIEEFNSLNTGDKSYPEILVALNYQEIE